MRGTVGKKGTSGGGTARTRKDGTKEARLLVPQEYRAAVGRTYLKPALGNVKLSELTAEYLDGLYRDRDLARGKGTPSGRVLAPSTVGQVYSTARVALGRGAKKGVILHNVARRRSA
jgi:hypothetical protein